MRFNQQQYRYTHTHTHTHTDTLSFSPPSLPHPVPLSLLVEQNNDQLGMHLVSVLAERQITPLKRHIHQVPVEGNVGEGRQRKRLFEAYFTSWKISLSAAALKCFICSVYLYHSLLNDSISQTLKFHCVSIYFLSIYLFRQTQWHETNSSSAGK